MFKNWYPVIDSDICNSCGQCIDFCSQAILEMIEDKIMISDKEECIWQCNECVEKCPQNAILNICDFQSLTSE